MLNHWFSHRSRSFCVLVPGLWSRITCPLNQFNFLSPHLIVDVDSTTTTSLLTTHSPSGARVVLPTSHSILPRPSISNLVNRPSFFSKKVQNRLSTHHFDLLFAQQLDSFWPKTTNTNTKTNTSLHSGHNLHSKTCHQTSFLPPNFFFVNAKDLPSL